LRYRAAVEGFDDVHATAAIRTRGGSSGQSSTNIATKLLKQNLMESADREPTSASCRSLPPALLCVNSGPSAPALGPLLCPAAESRVGPFLLALAIVNRRLQRCARSPLHARRHLSSGLCRRGRPGAAPPRRQDRYFVGGDLCVLRRSPDRSNATTRHPAEASSPRGGLNGSEIRQGYHTGWHPSRHLRVNSPWNIRPLFPLG
jgi:hypothetical protein